jgi:hypothetical protein
MKTMVAIPLVHAAVKPPSASRAVPVTNDALSDAADKADRDSEVPEGLELVQAPPEDFGSGRSRR